MFRLALASAAFFALATSAALAAPGSQSSPIELKMQVGTDIVTVHGVLRKNLDCCTYTFKAAAGQKAYFIQSGAQARVSLTYPDGTLIGPDTVADAPPLILPATGTYTVQVGPDLMTEPQNTYKAFTLTLKILPK